MRPHAPHPPAIADGTLEALKWLALVLMVLDHVNTFVYDRTLPGAYQAGRIVFPLFAFVLACNLARPGALARGVHVRVMRRLAIFAALATPAHWALLGHWWPMNILVTLLAGTATIYGLELAGAVGPEASQGGTAASKLLGVASAVVAFIAGGLVGDYLYPGVGMIVAAWAYCREPTPRHFVVWVLFTAGLVLVNFNFWALAAVPVVLLAGRFELRVPRLRWVFYAVYPLHLTVLWWVRDGLHWRR